MTDAKSTLLRFILASLVAFGGVLMAPSFAAAFASGAAAVGDEEDVAVSISTCPIAMTMDDLLKASSLVVLGTVVGQSEPFLVKSDSGGDPMPYTKFYLQPQRALWGESGGTVTVLVEGGEIPGEMKVTFHDAPVLEIGGQYVLFLYEQGNRGGVDSPGGCYYIVGFNQGLFVPNDERIFQMVSDSQSRVKSFLDSLAVFNEKFAIEDTDFQAKFLADPQQSFFSGLAGIWE